MADTRFHEPLELRSLAAEAGFSKYHFARAFTEAYGETPMRYVTRRRVERAQDLLRSANLSVTEISVMVGYNSLGSFTTRFTTLVGVSPSEYRNRHHVAGAARIPGCYLFHRGIDRVEDSDRVDRGADLSDTRPRAG